MKMHRLLLLSLPCVLALSACNKDETTVDDSTPTTDDSGDDTGTPLKDADNDGFKEDVDCDDLDAFIYPGAEETIGDGVDSDCDGMELCYEDADADGYGGENTVTSESLDCSAAGVSTTSDDCDDSSADYNPAATEDDCSDPNDYNCDGSTGFADADADGFAACEECDDTNAAINPDGAEITGDGIDQNCDGVDECFLDADGDTYASPGGETTPGVDLSCSGANETADNSTLDCDDADASINPGATEIWYDGTDSDCAGDDDYDADADGFQSDDHGGTDCDDGDSSINTDATDIAQNGTDEDCDGTDAPYSVTDLSAGDLVVTEVMQNSSAVTDDKGEWFEVQNLSGGTVDLDGLYVYDNGSNSFTVSGTLSVADKGYVVFGVNSDSAANGGASVDYDWGSSSSFSLSNSDDEIILAESSSKATEFDAAEWDGGTYWPAPNGASMNLDSDHLDPDENDFGPHWCESTGSFGDGDLGTPGSANESCNYTYTFDADISSILNNKCKTCHTTSSSGSMTAIGTWSTTVLTSSSEVSSMYRVDPFSTADSYLFHKISGTQSSVGGSGATMPKTGSLTTAEQDTIETWIEEGAAK